MSKPYKAKTLSGAQAYVRLLLRSRKETNALLDLFDRQRKALAKLAADGPCFMNPLDVYEAKTWRDEILKSMRLNPDGSFMP